MSFFGFQSSPDSDYNTFLENLVNKRRQIADSNPKNLTHFSGNSMSSSSNITQSPNTSLPNPELRPAKSIVIGAGQPIIVPGQRTNVINENWQAMSQVKQTTSTALKSVNDEKMTRSNLAPELSQVRTVHGDGKVTSVEEFCPDGGALDKGFLDDLPTMSNAIPSEARHTELNYDSDSDGNDTGNPLVAKFHDDFDPFEDLSAAKNSTKSSASLNQSNVSKTEPKVNPLAKNNKSKGLIQHDLGLVLTSKRRTSTSSDDIEIPNILQTTTNNSSDGQSNEEFDSWLSDTNQRRSPEGGEDETSIPSIDNSIRNPTLASIAIETEKIDRLELKDDDDDDVNSDKPAKEKSTKSKKKKKDKKEKKEKSGDKEKKRTKSKRTTAEDLLSEQPNHSERNAAYDDHYEAL